MTLCYYKLVMLSTFNILHLIPNAPMGHSSCTACRNSPVTKAHKWLNVWKT